MLSDTIHLLRSCGSKNTHAADDQYEIKDQLFNESPSSWMAGYKFLLNVQLNLKYL